MPIGTSIALGSLIAGAAAGGTAAAGIYGAHKAGDANDAATATQAKSSADAIALQREEDAQQRQQFDQQQAAAKAQWDAQQQLRAPYRQAGLSALSKLGDLLGTHFDTSMMQAPAYVPAGATPQNTGQATMKMNALMPQSGVMSPGARTVIDPTTGQPRVVLNA